MGSAWITNRTTSAGARRFRVEYRVGGREAPTRYGGSFKTKTEASGESGGSSANSQPVAYLTSPHVPARPPHSKLLA